MKTTILKHEIGIDYFSVLVKSKKLTAWIDISISNNDIETEWNQYIFHLHDPKDLHQRKYQDKLNYFEAFSESAIEYLLTNNLISQNENGDWIALN